jgi:anti-anti-sigma factor
VVDRPVLLHLTQKGSIIADELTHRSPPPEVVVPTGKTKPFGEVNDRGARLVLVEQTDPDVLPIDPGRGAKTVDAGQPEPAGEHSVRVRGTTQVEHGPTPAALSDMFFAVRRERLGEAVCVEVEGALDLASAPQLARELARAAAAEVPVVVADLAGVTLLDSTSLLVLVRASLELRARGGELVVRSPEGPGRRVFDLVDLDRPLTVLVNADGDTRTDGTGEAQRLGPLVSSLLDENAHLQRALTSRIVIEQAKGILAERLDLDVNAAFDVLRKTARDRRQRIHELAKAVVEGSKEAARLFEPA